MLPTRFLSRRFSSLTALLMASVVVVSRPPHAADSPEKTIAPQAAVAALQPFQKLIGEWRGIGQPQRGSNRGSWQETASAVWNLKSDPAGIRWQSAEGKLWQSWLLAPGDEQHPFQLILQVDDQTERRYAGKLEGARLILETAATPQNEVHRLTFTWLGNDRTLILAEKRGAQQSFYQRVAEVAYQRQGTRLAAKDGNGPECVVTGGLGTIAVTHEGKTYYLCCTGCRDAFNDDPVGILKEWAERQKKKTATSP